MRRLMSVILLLYCYLGVGCDILATVTSPKKTALVMEEVYSTQLRIKKVGENLYIAAKIDKETDILYWFKKCMFNELFTFYRVGITPNHSQLPIANPDSIPLQILNLAFSDNIGPFNITGHGWCGGNHPYVNGVTRTAYNISSHAYLDGKELMNDTIAWANDIQIKVVNNIMNPSLPLEKRGDIQLNNLLCVETAVYCVKGNSIEVSLTHLFRNTTPIVVQMYYGMQSMFGGELQTLTANGKYTDWIFQENISSFFKKDYPRFRRFVEKSPIAYQSTYLLEKGLGTHSEISENDIVFIGNSNGKAYHKVIANKWYKEGDSTFWNGIYTWFRTPILDDDDMLCYDGIIGGKNAIFIDCKKNINIYLTLPTKYRKKRFTVMEKSESIILEGSEIRGNGIRILSRGAGSCIIVID